MASMKGLAILLGKGKPAADEEEGEGGDGGGDEDQFLGEAHDALKDDDKEGFVRAMKGAIEACIQGYKS